MTSNDPLQEVRAKILKIIELNPYNYENLSTYRRALKRERELVAAEMTPRKTA